MPLYEADPRVGRASLAAAAATGDAAWVAQRLHEDPGAATAIDAERGWPPLLYVCYSRWHWVRPERAEGMAGVARLLLAAGADPNTSNGDRRYRGYRSALHGAVTSNSPAILALLLRRGANPDDGESLHHAVRLADASCLELLLSHGADAVGNWALDAAASMGYTDQHWKVSVTEDAAAVEERKVADGWNPKAMPRTR